MFGEIAACVAGAVLIYLALADVYHTLFHPVGTGSVSNFIMGRTWRFFRWAFARRPAMLRYAGPLILLEILGAWVALNLTGFALIYLPFLPDRFRFGTGLTPGGGAMNAFSVSAEILVTLGLGDVTPKTGWLRLLVPAEAVVGFVVLTASLSWVLSVYPVLGRRRALAYAVSAWCDTRQKAPREFSDPDLTGHSFLNFASKLSEVRADLVQFPITYFFREEEAISALSRALPSLWHAAAQAAMSGRTDFARGAALGLIGAIESFSELIGGLFVGLKHADVDRVLDAYAADHLQETTPLRTGQGG